MGHYQRIGINMDILDFLQKQEENVKEIKKSLYRSIANKNKKVAQAIVEDIKDNNHIAEVPDKLEPPTGTPVMQKSKDKGVHKPYMSQGESFAGEIARQGKRENNPAKKEMARKLHSQKGKEIKDIKPNLPKSEDMGKNESLSRNIWHPEKMKEGHTFDFEGKKHVVIKQRSEAQPSAKTSKPRYYTTIKLHKDPSDKMNKSEKAIHEMTRKEFEDKHGKSGKKSTVTGGFHPHESAVETALNQGKTIPEHVLKDYPHLKPINKKAPEGVNPEKHESCVKQVKKQGKDVGSAHAICSSSLKKEEIEKADKVGKYGLSTNTNRKIRFQNEKGINKPTHMGQGGVGESGMGYTVRGGQYANDVSDGAYRRTNSKDHLKEHAGGYDRELARKKAKSTLRDMKDMPKPNLPKSEENVKIPKKDLIEEHKKLVEVLESKSHKDDKKEAKDQKKELKDYMKKGLSSLKEFLVKREN